ncbi:UvrABC system protein A [Pirellula sp. SH-Sr6A]|uniref:excinuclease ABC subunit UvrA n=1 Tax=Pirellula sp. SH-Sr6A TaxID=1632865 RepID=UPI00078DBDB0|nr:ABC-ATPase UvrA [Pirellula sp. SH-Sr6A]AMV35198.1 UvrABC system protein A [Pirellula sp. SH-Sr6A]
MISEIEIRGARTHNLKGIDLDIPRGKFVVITGVSGSGKSSLAIDTLFAEGQRQYLESLSSYARQFVDQMERPDVDIIRGLQPSLCIDQKQGSLSPRSTVGTVTEIYDYLRLLMARVAIPACHQCGRPIERQSPSDILQAVLRFPSECKLVLLAPMVLGRKGSHADVFDRISKAGLVRVKVDGTFYEMDDLPTLAVRKEHTISAVVDRMVLRPEQSDRIQEAMLLALRLSNGLIEVHAETRGDGRATGETLEQFFSTRFACTSCGINLLEVEPRTFSFNSSYGACPACEGFGSQDGGDSICDVCHGSRLKKESLAIKLEGMSIADLSEMSLSRAADWFSSLSLEGNRGVVGSPIRKEIVTRMRFLCDVGLGYLTLARSASTLSGGELQRVRLATSIGTGMTGVCYVLDEPSVGLHPRDTSSLIESLRMLQQKGNSVIVVEHDTDMMRASDWIVDFGPGAGHRGGRVVGEGKPQQFFHPSSVKAFPESITSRHLAGALSPPAAIGRAIDSQHPCIGLKGIRLHNVQELDVHIPIRRLVGVSGVSGSGKSTIVHDTLAPAMKAVLQGELELPNHLGAISGYESIDKVIEVDQSPIGRSPRSIPATYCGFWDEIRKLYASTKDAKQRGFLPAHFSFNSGNGRCEVCSGQGRQKLEMNFLADVYVLCPRCRGSRFQRTTLAVRFKEKSIAQVLDLSIEEACEFFSEIPKIHAPLEALCQVGLGYMPLGQPATTISGGEAQRIKLATELSRAGTGNTLYLLDEPTSGLHTEDVHRLIGVLQTLVDKGNSVLVIEHHMDVLGACDWVIDMGPDAGVGGGQIVGSGPPEAIAAKETPTGRALRAARENGRD